VILSETHAGVGDAEATESAGPGRGGSPPSISDDSETGLTPIRASPPPSKERRRARREDAPR